MRRLWPLALLLGLLAGLPGPTGAGALAPTATAYWVKTGSPPPNVPKGGLLVGDDPGALVNPSQPPPLPASPPPAPVQAPGPQLTGYTAESGVRITGVKPGASATLTLVVAQPSSPPVPSVSTIVACRIAGTWTPPSGGVGDISKAPASDCSEASVGRVAADFSAVSWLLPASWGTDGEFDVMIQPGVSATPVPYVLAFNAPDLKSVNAPEGGPVEAPPVAAAEPAPSSAPPAVAPGPSAPFRALTTALAPQPYVAPVTPVARSTGGGVPTVRLAQNAGITVKVPDDRAHRIMAVSVLFAMALGLWWLSGREGRAPKRLGSLAGEPSVALAAGGALGAGVAAAAGADVRGVGRFRHPRIGPAQRLV